MIWKDFNVHKRLTVSPFNVLTKETDCRVYHLKCLTTRLSLNHLSFVFVTWLLVIIKEVKFMKYESLLNVWVGIWWPRLPVILFYVVQIGKQLSNNKILPYYLSHNDLNLSKSKMENFNQKNLITFIDKKTKQNRILKSMLLNRLFIAKNMKKSWSIILP